ncbi:hypothetical protein [uncultured Roseobacter sp.]|uniref:hypothetical protein n=1 Tax=uncultured Roseobacter sp. TaxID=114847 RepID=UPI002639FC63|nr:hypothetical protein [uncultured Roseobacter sp.]
MNSVQSATPDLRIAYVLDPRFPGGTSSAVAAELEVVSTMAQVQVFGLETDMFSGQRVAPQLSDTLLRLNIPFHWANRDIAADIVIFHNPSCLKFQDTLGVTILARHLVVVTHENFLRPGGAEAFDVAKCLDQIAAASVTLDRWIAPISAWNRSTVTGWDAANRLGAGWSLLDTDWFNICAFDMIPPTSSPRDRRGRHSRPGLEKFPQRDVLEMCFPQTAAINTILGADSLMQADDLPSHWSVHPFGGLTLQQYFDKIDFLVYYTAPTWRESFGRVIAEAVAAGKIAITDPETARTFEGAAISAAPEEIDQVIANYIAAPDRYRADVLSGQQKLARFSAAAFKSRMGNFLTGCAGATS